MGAATPPRFPVICGPTASGKSDLALAVAEGLRTRGFEPHILAADAFQVYRGMDIGTAKPPTGDRRDVPHHLIDLVEPTEGFTVDQWLTRAEALLEELRSPNRPGPPSAPLVVGGTHLYIKALLEGLFEGPAADPALRASLAAMEASARRAELERVDPGAAARIHPNDTRRTIRALEVFRLTGTPISRHQKQWDRAGPRADALLVCLMWPTEALNRRINARVKAMIEAGLVDEVRGLWVSGRLGPQAREALGYKQLLGFLGGDRSLDEAVEAIKIETRRFAKNQRTWLRRLGALPGAIRLDGTEMGVADMAQIIVNQALV